MEWRVECGMDKEDLREGRGAEGMRDSEGESGNVSCQQRQ